ncbi:MAG: hypothetical protein ACI87N_002717 [Flavobacteriales bacterium]|jgi:hypothetical protein
MNQETFSLLTKISNVVYYKFDSYGGSNREQRIHDSNLEEKLQLLQRYGLVVRVNADEFSITEKGQEIATYSNWAEYLKHRKHLNEQKRQKELNEFTITKFQKRTRYWPLLISLISIVLSIFALTKKSPQQEEQHIKQSIKKQNTIHSKSKNKPKNHELDSLDIDTVSLITKLEK